MTSISARQRELPNRDLERVLHWAVDPEVGLLKHITELTLHPGMPDVFIAVAEFQDPLMISPDNPYARDRKLFASGAGLTKETAVWATVGEAVERYAGSIYFESELVTGSYAELRDTALDSREMIGFSDEQYAAPGFPFPRFDPQAPRRWLRGHDLTNKREILVPAAGNVLGYLNQYPNELLDRAYSTGLSAGRDYAHATLGAVREVVERDAFTCHWYTGLSPRRLRLEDVDAIVAPRVRPLLRVPGTVVDVLNITTEFGVPCILAFVRRENGPGVSLGCCCHLDAGLAIEKALVEAYHCFAWILDVERVGTPHIAIEDIKSFEDHTHYYLEPSRFPNLAFLFQGDYGPPPPNHPGASADARGQLDALVATLKSFGHRTLAIDETSDDVRQLGFAVVKALVPGLHPINGGWRSEHRDTRRLKAFCTARGIPLPALNLAPHPFP